MTNKKLGQEAAFPGVEVIGDNKIVPFNGMSKRFYAACVAMQGMLANPDYTSLLHRNKEGFISDCYSITDELLRQENEQKV